VARSAYPCDPDIIEFEGEATMSNEATAVHSPAAGKAAPMITEAVLQNHLRAARIGVDAVMQDYTDQSILITHEATYRGLAEIRGFFTALFRQLPAGFFETVRMQRQEIVGEVAYILWQREPVITQATDTFVVRNGKILVQTFAAYPAR
jgi:hypothetical protein